jgi:hypothetical protein
VDSWSALLDGVERGIAAEHAFVRRALATHPSVRTLDVQYHRTVRSARACCGTARGATLNGDSPEIERGTCCSDSGARDSHLFPQLRERPANTPAAGQRRSPRSAGLRRRWFRP